MSKKAPAVLPRVKNWDERTTPPPDDFSNPVYKKPIKFVIKKRVNRTLEGQEDIQTQLNKHIDRMHECTSHYSFALELRSSLTGQASFPKKYIRDLENPSPFSTDTNLGTISFIPGIMISQRKAHIEDILEKMQIILPEDQNEYGMTYILKSEKTKMFLNSKVLDEKKELIEQLGQTLATMEIKTDGLDEEQIKLVRFVTGRKHMLKLVYKKAKQFVSNFNNLKKIFRKHSTTGTFPRIYHYRDVYLYWGEGLNTISYSAYKHLHLLDEENGTALFEEFQKRLKDIGIAENKFKYDINLDNFDYTDFQTLFY